jgi:hypothetical protein
MVNDINTASMPLKKKKGKIGIMAPTAVDVPVIHPSLIGLTSFSYKPSS